MWLLVDLVYLGTSLTRTKEKEANHIKTNILCPLANSGGFPVDFLYLPCPRVGIINFISHELCLLCFQTISQRIKAGAIRVIKVQQAGKVVYSHNIIVFQMFPSFRNECFTHTD